MVWTADSENIAASLARLLRAPDAAPNIGALLVRALVPKELRHVT